MTEIFYNVDSSINFFLPCMSEAVLSLKIIFFYYDSSLIMFLYRNASAAVAVDYEC